MSIRTAEPFRTAAPWLKVRSERIASIDAFRALTVLVMITVNAWPAVTGLPQWMGHMPADADAMTFVDAVFPAFLFIVGMSIPFAMQQRFSKGDTVWQVQAHVLARALGLVVIGFFMVNAESGWHAEAMPISIKVWGLLCYVAAFLVWGSLSGGPALGLPWRLLGVGLFMALAFIYRGGPAGDAGMTPQWWGILGLIGWAYWLACLSFQLCRARVPALLACIVICIAYFVLHRMVGEGGPAWLRGLLSQEGHFSHAALVLSGCVTALLFFDESRPRSPARRFASAFAFTLLLALAAAWLRPEFKISKIHATPSWALYSAAASVLIFSALYWWIDRRGRMLWPALLEPVAANPLVAYLLPSIIGGLMGLAGLAFPSFLRQGAVGIGFFVFYALAVGCLVKCLAAWGVRLRI